MNLTAVYAAINSPTLALVDNELPVSYACVVVISVAIVGVVSEDEIGTVINT